MPSVFSKIISGEIPCFKVAETTHCFAFLDVFPLREGHVLVVPKSEVDNIFDLENNVYDELWQLSQRIAVSIKKVMPCTKVGVAVIGLEVPHAHIHLVPINDANDLNFTQAKIKIEMERLQEISKLIIAQLDSKL
jgi:histidine triad (HIT) family protein